MNPIFKVKHGTYVDLSRIVAIDFTSAFVYCPQSTIHIYFDMDERDKLFKYNASEVSELKWSEATDPHEPELIDLILGPRTNNFERNSKEANIDKSLEIVKNRMIEKYKHLVDAWEEYKIWHSKYTE